MGVDESASTYEDLKPRVATETDHLSNECRNRVQTYTDILPGGVLAYPLARILLQEVDINLAVQSPTLHTLRVEAPKDATDTETTEVTRTQFLRIETDTL